MKKREEHPRKGVSMCEAHRYEKNGQARSKEQQMMGRD